MPKCAIDCHANWNLNTVFQNMYFIVLKGSRIKEQSKFISEKVLKIKLKNIPNFLEFDWSNFKSKIPLKLKCKKEANSQKGKEDNIMRPFGQCRNCF